MKKIFILMCVVASCFSAMAQTYDNPWNIGVYGGRAEYNGEYGKHFFDVTSKFYGFGALSASYYLTNRFDVALYGAFGRYGAVDKRDVEFKSTLGYADLTLKFKLVNNDKALFRPYIFLGFGGRYLYEDKNSSNVEPGFDMVVPGGAGIDLRLSDKWTLRYIASYGYAFSDNQDKRDCSNFGDQQLLHNVGLTYSFATKPRDTDKDGVIDKLDECKETPEGVKVDDKGCPVDTDKDGVADYKDKCQGTPAGVEVDDNGCPVDTDKDGVADYKDECPETPEGVKVDDKGCPVDTDEDGVADYLDKCPDTPKGAKGFVTEDGCPIDTDEDGVYNFEDKCPEVKGIKENKGCPEIKEEHKKVLQKALTGIEFDSGKSTIKRTSNTILDQVANIMKENPVYLLDINGHTDNVGNADKNLTLSQERANAVKAYLEGKGVEAKRMTATGFGDAKPIADNKTASGRTKNRRVEFIINF